MSLRSSHLALDSLFILALVFIAAVAIFRVHGYRAELREVNLHVREAQDAIDWLDQLQIQANQCRSLCVSETLDLSDDQQKYTWLGVFRSFESTYEIVSRSCRFLNQDTSFQQIQDVLVAFDTLVNDEIRSHDRGIFPTPDQRNQLQDRLGAVLAYHYATTGNIVRHLIQKIQRLAEIEKTIIAEVGVAFALAMILIIVYVYSVNLLLARPIRQLATTARAVTSGELSARTPETGDGPVANLAVDFNNMVEILVDSLAQEERVVAELRKRTRQLEEANRHKSQFLATVSHELKTPLNAIIGFADILSTQRHGSLAERQRDYIRRVHIAGRHLLDMISDLIDIARIDVNALTLNYDMVDARSVVEEACEMVMPQLENKRHTISVKSAEKAVTAKVDASRLKQIVLNLLSNAIKFTPAEGKIEVTTRNNKGRIEISVKDNGIGIAPDDREKVFEDFVQLDSALHRHHEGTGIGLSLTRRLVTEMGGEISLESETNKGSCFYVYFPVASKESGEFVEESPKQETN